MSSGNYNIRELISKKRDGKSFTDDEMKFFIEAVAKKQVDDAQIGAWLMAVRLQDMIPEETAFLTKSMIDTGFKFSWPEEWRHLVVDKHSTGGVGDKVTLVLTPALAACGLKVPTITGRGLAHTGGTLDKLESIPGFSCSVTAEQIVKMVDTIGCCIVGQTDDVAPADKVLYKIRDVTATVDSIPLITGSILSKKVAESPVALVIDVKLGKAAVFPDQEYATKLANALVSVANLQGVKTTAILSRMDNPIGNMIGNALEIAEVIECLHGGGPTPLVNLIEVLGGHVLYNVGRASSVSEGTKALSEVLKNGGALEKFKAVIKAQGVAAADADALCAKNADVFSVLSRSALTTPVTAPDTGYIVEIDALVCAEVSNSLGAGRRNTNDKLDYSVGIQIHRHVGDQVNKGDKVLTVHHSKHLNDGIVTKLQNAIKVDAVRPDPNIINQLVIRKIDINDV